MNTIEWYLRASSVLLVSACAQQAPVVVRANPAAPAKTSAGADAGAAAAAATPIFRLPADVRPTRERVELEIVPERETFSGRVEVGLRLDQPRGDLWISARELDLTDGTLAIGGEVLAVTVEKHDDRGAARLVLPHLVREGPAILSLAFHAPYNPLLVGLYRVKSDNRWYAFTQFEAVEARRAFPCFDEPAIKIPYEVVLVVPKELVAVANTPVTGETAAGELKKLRFAPTRPLPSYLIAVAVGDFDVVTPPPLPPNEVRSRPLQVRGIAPKGRGGQLAYALKSGGELLVLLERWFGTPYPYEKLDHIAVPDYQYGAMENVGLITYRDADLLVDPKTASEDQKLGVASTMAHEIAHQWFGDLVTMSWWDDLWLNESFASFMETQITAAWAPGSRYDLVKLKAAHGAMGTDELSTVHPIRTDIAVEGDIFGTDFEIAYEKGQSVISMFQQFLGPEEFRAGIRRYLAAHADGSATRDDLVAALSTSAADMRPVMHSFVDQAGIPLVQARLRCDRDGARVALSQSRQLPLGSTATKDVHWAVPVCVRSEGGASKPDCMLLDAAEGELALNRKSCPAWIALNPGAQGYYRWTLPPDGLHALLSKGYAQLSPAERLSVGNNLAAVFRSGALSAADVLAALGPLARDPEPAVAEEPGTLLRVMHDHIVEPKAGGAVQAHMRALYGPVLARIGWKAQTGEPSRVSAFRGWLVEYLALEAADPAVLAKAGALGRAYLGTDGHLHPEAVDGNLVPAAIAAAARLGSADLFDTILERLTATNDGSVRGHLLDGLAQFVDPTLAERARGLAFDDRLRVNERFTVLLAQARRPENRPGAWAWVTQNFEAVAPRIPPTEVQVLVLVQGGCSEEAASELKESFGPRIASFTGAPYLLSKAIENARLCAATAAAQRQSATEFFQRKRTSPSRQARSTP